MMYTGLGLNELGEYMKKYVSKKTIPKVVAIAFCVLLFGVFAYGILGELFLPSEMSTSGGYFQEFTQDWYQVLEDGTREKFDLPNQLKVEGDEVVFEHELPAQISEDAYVVFRTAKQDYRVYVDGLLREEYSTEDSRLWGLTSPAYYLFVKVNSKDSGKIIQVRTTGIESKRGDISFVYYANYSGFWSAMIREQGMTFLIEIIMFVIGLLTGVVSLALQIIYKKRQKLLSISMGVIIVSLWMLGNSMFRQLIFSNVSVISDITFLMVTFIPTPYAFYMDQLQKQRYSVFYFIAEILALGNMILCTILYVAGIKDFVETFIWMAGVLFYTIAVIVITMVIDLAKGHIKEYWMTAIALVFAAIAAIAQVINYLSVDNAFDISIAAFGLVLMLVVAMIETIRDMSEIEKERQLAIVSSDTKSKFLANMSHEIRTPINAVLGLDTMILRECKDPAIKKYALDIQSSGRSLLSLINDILDFSKIESGKMELVYSEYEIAGMINDITNMIQPKADDKGLEFIVHMDETMPSSYIGDDVRIKQIIVNLLTNAVKYTNEGKVELFINATRTDSKADISVKVKDTGIGIKEEDISKLSEEFVRIEESRNRNIEGTGLGISIVVNLLKLMGSKLEIESIYGKGSEFYFTISQTISKEEPVGKLKKRFVNDKKVEEYQAKFCIPDSRLLVVDDNSINRLVFINLLKDLKCPIDEAESGIQCLELVKQKKYDIIFMDHMMPELDGVETFRLMKQMGEYINADTPVVVLTANAISGAKEEYLAEGFRAYLSKPVDADRLETMIGSLIPNEKKIASTKSKEKFWTEARYEDELPFIDGVDWNSAMNLLKSEKMLMDSIDDFCMMAKSELSTLKGMYENLLLKQNDETFSAYRSMVHSMMTKVVTIGANHVAGLAKYLEYAARDKDLDTIKRLMPVFEKEWNALKMSYDDIFGV